jgi:hypothetical protein
MKNSLNWFEIVVTDMPKASAFYAAVVGKPLQLMTFQGTPHAVFAADGPGAITGALVVDPARKPAPGGTVIFLDVDRVELAVARAREAGGTIVQPPLSIGEHGTAAIIADRDGNHVGLHAPKS